jgi:hypothetical protein
MLRRPPRFEKQERTFVEKLLAQWAGLLGLLLLGIGALLFLGLRYTSMYLATRCSALVIAFGVGCLGYWAFTNHNDDYTSV